MTKARREEILSKDILRIADVQELNNMSYQMAAKLIRDIKRAMNPMFSTTGQLATSDYMAYFSLRREAPTEKLKPVRKEKHTPLFRMKEYQ